MFHWNIFTTTDATRFLLVVPIHSVGLLLTVLFLLMLAILGRKPGQSTRNYVWFAIVLLVSGFLSYSSELTLDRGTRKATLREFEFFHWTSHTYDLNQVERVYVSTGSTTSQLRMQFTDGNIRSLSFLDQAGGKDEVAYKANAFLGTSVHE